MSLPSLLLTKSMSNDIGVGFTYIGSIPPFLCPLFYLEQIFLPSFVYVICISNRMDGNEISCTATGKSHETKLSAI